MDKSTLGNRMKEYEATQRTTLMRRCPVIVRVDGKKFSRFTKVQKCEKPFDKCLTNAMQQAMIKTAKSIEGCVFGYTQSDEMTFVILNDQSLESQPWFGNRVQKICSVVASTVTAHFNSTYFPYGFEYPALFDARVFSVPNLCEAANALVWRQNDATKNSISASCFFEIAKVTGKKTAQKKMHGLSQKQQQELLFQETGINWDRTATELKRGSACYKELIEVDTEHGMIMRNKWLLNTEIPIFMQDNLTWLINILSHKEIEIKKSTL